jgi:hypothetical protein
MRRTGSRPGADHIYNVLTPDQTQAEAAIAITADWFDARM